MKQTNKSYRRRATHCRVNKCDGQPWQSAAVRDHWPIEVHVRLPQQWPAERQKSSAITWNEHAIAMEEAALLPEQPLVSNQSWRLRVVLRALQLTAIMEQARKAVKADVQAWNRHLLQELDDATAARGHKTAWSVCPSSCWRDNRQRTSRYPNRLGSSISAKYNWPLKQLNQVKLLAVLTAGNCPALFSLCFLVMRGAKRWQLLQAVCPEARPHLMERLLQSPPLPHQYGYPPHRPRRDAILQLTVLLERLIKAGKRLHKRQPV